jgi:hypothetical protein
VSAPRLLLGLLTLAAVLAAFLLLSGGRSPSPSRAPAAGSQSPGPPPAPTTGSPSTTPAPAQLQPAQPAPAGEQFGVNVNRLFNDGTFTQAQIASQLEALAATGAKLARSDALWEASEPTAPAGAVHHYNWGFDDRIAGSLANQGLAWLPIIDYSAPWAQSIPGEDHSPPASASDYAAYAGALAARYGATGSFWREHPLLTARPVSTYEIWNEPDNGEFWTPTPDPAGYADLYLAARTAILAADPGARAIVGGLTNPTSFLPAMLTARATLRGHVDGVAVHPYGSPLVVLGKLRTDRATLDALGFSTVPLYVTEFGWSTEPRGTLNYAPAAVRPRYIATTMGDLGHLDCGIAAAVLYTWVTPEQNPTDREDWYGIHGPAGAPTAASAAFARGVHVAQARAPTIHLCRG